MKKRVPTKARFFLFALAIALGGLITGNKEGAISVQAASQPEVTYHLIVKDPASHIMHVVAEVKEWQGGQISFRLMTYQDLTFTVSMYCSHETKTSPWHYAHLSAHAEDGTELPVHLIAKGTENRDDAVVVVNPQGHQQFRFEYDVIPVGGESFGLLPGETHDRLASYLGKNFGVFFERYVLFLPTALPLDTPVHFRFNLPAGWNVITPWREEKGGYVTELRSLVQTGWYWGEGIAVGPFEMRRQLIGPTEVRVAVSSSIPKSLREKAFQVAFGSFAFIQSKYGRFPAPIFMGVIYDEPSPKTCYGGKHEAYPIMNLLRGDATIFINFQYVQGPNVAPNAPPMWQGISDEMSYLWMEMTANERGATKNLDCWVMYQGNPLLYTYAAYQTGVWDEDWRGTGYRFVNPKIWFYYHDLDYSRIWIDDHWLYKEEIALLLDHEIQRRTLGYFHFWDVVGRIYRENADPCSLPNVIRTIRKVTGQDFSDWFNEFVFSPQAMENRTQVYYKDSDHDGVWDWIEEDVGLDPNNPDTDGDGLSDGTEIGLEWMLASSPVGPGGTFSDPLSADSPGGGLLSSPNPSAEQPSGNASSPPPTEQPFENASPPLSADISSAQITPDGNSDEWPNIAPFKTDPQEANIADDITAFYTFHDEEYLYLRLDGRFSTSPDAQFTFDMLVRPFSGGGHRVQVSTNTSEPDTLHVIPLDGQGQPIFDQQVMYQGCALSQTTYEAVIPWKILGGKAPKEIIIRPYIIHASGGIIEALHQLDMAYFLTPSPAQMTQEATSAPSPTKILLTATATPKQAKHPAAPSPLPRYAVGLLFFLIGIGLGWFSK